MIQMISMPRNAYQSIQATTMWHSHDDRFYTKFCWHIDDLFHGWNHHFTTLQTETLLRLELFGQKCFEAGGSRQTCQNQSLFVGCIIHNTGRFEFLTDPITLLQRIDKHEFNADFITIDSFQTVQNFAVISKKKLPILMCNQSVDEIFSSFCVANRSGNALSCPPINVVLGSLKTRSISFSSAFACIQMFGEFPKVSGKSKQTNEMKLPRRNEWANFEWVNNLWFVKSISCFVPWTLRFSLFRSE